ncbi:MAG: CDP-alcohol phosphatidyltransferase family protein [Acidobacteria bacterium]|nr:CDP-alcohol phosphatidyltransferase family protein [Acidobacteriota bacterium]
MTQLVTLANIVTVSRMILVPVFVSFIFYHQFTAALIVWVVAGVTDLLDGLLARMLNQTTSLGVILDPMADKLLLVTAFVVLSLPSYEFKPIPFWLTTVVISRDVFIVIGALMIFITTGFRRFRPSMPGKINTLVQLGVITAFLAANTVGEYTRYLPPLYYLTLAMALISGIHYIFHATRLLNEQGSNER